MEESILKKYVSSAPWSIIGKIWESILGIAISIVTVRELGKELYGDLSLVRNSMNYIILGCSLGLGQGILRYISELSEKKDYKGIETLAKQTITIQVILTIFALLLVYLIRNNINTFFKSDISILLIISILVYFPTIIRSTLNGIIFALFKVRFLTIISIIVGTIMLPLTYIVLKLGWGIEGLIILGGFQSLIFIPPLMWEFKKIRLSVISNQLSGGSRQFAITNLSFIRVLKYSLVFVGIGLINLIVQKQSEVFFIGHYLTRAEVGWYNLGYSFSSQLLDFIPGTLWGLGLVSITQVYTRNKADLSRSITLYYKFLFFIVIPIIVVGVLISDKAIVILYGKEMAPAGFIAQAIFLIHGSTFISVPLTTAIYAVEKPWFNLPLGLFVAILNLSCDYFFIPRYGMNGAIIALTITFTIGGIVKMYAFAKFLGGWYIPGKYLLKCLLASSLCLILILLRKYVSSFITLISFCSFSVLLFLIGIKVFGLIGKEEREVLMRINSPLLRIIKFI